MLSAVCAGGVTILSPNGGETLSIETLQAGYPFNYRLDRAVPQAKYVGNKGSQGAVVRAYLFKLSGWQYQYDGPCNPDVVEGCEHTDKGWWFTGSMTTYSMLCGIAKGPVEANAEDTVKCLVGPVKPPAGGDWKAGIIFEDLFAPAVCVPKPNGGELCTGAPAWIGKQAKYGDLSNNFFTITN